MFIEVYQRRVFKNVEAETPEEAKQIVRMWLELEPLAGDDAIENATGDAHVEVGELLGEVDFEEDE